MCSCCKLKTPKLLGSLSRLSNISRTIWWCVFLDPLLSNTNCSFVIGQYYVCDWFTEIQTNRNQNKKVYICIITAFHAWVMESWSATFDLPIWNFRVKALKRFHSQTEYLVQKNTFWRCFQSLEFRIRINNVLELRYF